MTFRDGRDGWMSHWYDHVLPVVSNVSHDDRYETDIGLR